METGKSLELHTSQDIGGAQLSLSSGYLGEPGEGALRLPQSAEAGAVVGLQSLLLALLLTDQLFGGGTVHLGPVELHS